MFCNIKSSTFVIQQQEFFIIIMNQSKLFKVNLWVSVLETYQTNDSLLMLLKCPQVFFLTLKFQQHERRGKWKNIQWR